VACYLRAWGAAFNPDAFVAQSSLSWDPVWRKGQRRKIVRPGHPERYEDSGVTILAGAGEQLPAQTTAVVAFLRANEAEVNLLLKFPGVDGAVLDFGVHWGDDIAAKFFRFSPELLRLAVGWNLELELSVYDSRGAAPPGAEGP